MLVMYTGLQRYLEGTKMNEKNLAIMEKSLDILTKFQKWRLGKVDDYPFDPKELTGAINVAIDLLQLTTVNARAKA